MQRTKNKSLDGCVVIGASPGVGITVEAKLNTACLFSRNTRK